MNPVCPHMFFMVAVAIVAVGGAATVATVAVFVDFRTSLSIFVAMLNVSSDHPGSASQMSWYTSLPRSRSQNSDLVSTRSTSNESTSSE